jgi:hypothetical protein
MTHRSLVSIGELAALMAVMAWVASVPVASQGPSPAKANGAAAKAYTPPRTADGQPDLSGYWTNATHTPLERPKNVTKEFYTPEELEELAAARQRAAARETGSVRAVHYNNEQFGIDKSLATFPRSLRTSLIVDPPDGRIPPQIPEAVKRNAAIAAARKLPAEGDVDLWSDQQRDVDAARTMGYFDAVQNMGYDERCLIRNGTAPPIYNSGYLSNYQIIQSPGFVAILAERLSEARVIPLDGRPLPSSNVRSWKGISRGHWEGNTLVVETRNSNGRAQELGRGLGRLVGATENLRVTERFTRVDANTMQYRFTMEDEKTWARPWTAEFPFMKMDPEGPFIEFACHEGNRAIVSILSVARQEEKRAAEAAAKKRSN